MQGIDAFIPTDQKVLYINHLLDVGFDVIDVGSFVSPKAIPQMRDTAEVLDRIHESNTELLVIVANQRGAEEAVKYSRIQYLGFPLSISETFQQRNTNASIDDAFKRITDIQELCIQYNKKLVVYLSMAFGNPYGDAWDGDILFRWTQKLQDELGVEIVSLADTTGEAKPTQISEVMSGFLKTFPKLEIGAHFHATLENWKNNIEAAYKAGCRRFDGALKGFGGCPMAKDDLTGNIPTELLISYFLQQGESLNIEEAKLSEAVQAADQLFNAQVI